MTEEASIVDRLMREPPEIIARVLQFDTLSIRNLNAFLLQRPDVNMYIRWRDIFIQNFGIEAYQLMKRVLPSSLSDQILTVRMDRIMVMMKDLFILNAFDLNYKVFSLRDDKFFTREYHDDGSYSLIPFNDTDIIYKGIIDTLLSENDDFLHSILTNHPSLRGSMESQSDIFTLKDMISQYIKMRMLVNRMNSIHIILYYQEVVDSVSFQYRQFSDMEPVTFEIERSYNTTPSPRWSSSSRSGSFSSSLSESFQQRAMYDEDERSSSEDESGISIVNDFYEDEYN